MAWTQLEARRTWRPQISKHAVSTCSFLAWNNRGKLVWIERRSSSRFRWIVESHQASVIDQLWYKTRWLLFIYLTSQSSKHVWWLLANIHRLWNELRKESERKSSICISTEQWLHNKPSPQHGTTFIWYRSIWILHVWLLLPASCPSCQGASNIIGCHTFTNTSIKHWRSSRHLWHSKENASNASYTTST